MTRHARFTGLFLFAALLCGGEQLWANPKGLGVGHGHAVATTVGNTLNLHVSNGAVLNWSSFNIGVGETTTFFQPNSHSVVWNNISDVNPSEILGSLNANGYVVLMNPNGIYIGDHAYVTANGFIASAAPLVRTGGEAGAFWQFDGVPPSASVINYGQINVGNGGFAYLVAPAVENHGAITAPDGKIGLFAGKELLLSARPDGRGLSASVTLPSGSVDNSGKLIADAGAISIAADVVNQNGLIQANSVRQRNGVIELVANDSIDLGASSVLSATGDAGVSAGGKISIQGGQEFSDAAGSMIDVSGGARGGNGGSVELCADQIGSIQSQLLALAAPGWLGGHLLIDPDYIVIGSGITFRGAIPSGGTEPVTANAGKTLDLNDDGTSSTPSAFQGFSTIDLQAKFDITLENNWDLATSTGLTGGGSLTLEAGRNIIFTTAGSLTGTAGWLVEMVAGRNFGQALSPLPTNPDQTPGLDGITSGAGGIYFNGGPADSSGVYPAGPGSVDMTAGNIDLRAGTEVILGSGYVRSENGNLSIVTGSGDVSTVVNNGSQQTGYQNTITGSIPNPTGAGGVSGFAVQGNGDLAINAGGGIECSEHNLGCFGIGVWGAGDLTLTAGNSVFGEFLVHDGDGTINAPEIGSVGDGVTLALATGHWNLNAVSGSGGAQGDIYLNEIFNPQGLLNTVYKVGGLGNVYDYAPDASLTLTAGNSVTLGPVAISSITEPIYPPILDISAGAGGVTLGKNVVLFPAADAALDITTTDDGPLTSVSGQKYALIMSDSASADYVDFGSGHSSPPLQEPYAAVPITLNISGDMSDLNTQFPKRSMIDVGGNMVNCFLTDQNLQSSDTSEVNVMGDILYATSTSASALIPGGDPAPNLAIFQSGVLGSSLTSVLSLVGSLGYNPATRELTYTGPPISNPEYQFLLKPVVYVYDQYGNQVFNSNGQPETQSAAFEPASVITALYTASQQLAPFSVAGVPGMYCGGPGQFIITADNLQLGISGGIQSVLAALNPALDKSFSQGAEIEIDLRGDLNMVASTIGTFNGGAISIDCQGSVNVGSQTQLTSADIPKGIYTAHGGDVDVMAVGDVDVNGSRIAAYDGGNVTVTSITGSVDAGNGGVGEFSITTPQLLPDGVFDPNFTDTFFGSGILALTGQRSSAVVGNITITAARDISAGAGGIFQDAFDNSPGSAHAQVVLKAGRDIVSTSAGILGENLTLKAGDEIVGLIVSQGSLDVTAIGKVNVTAVAVGDISISSQSTVSGDVFGGQSVDVSASSISGSIATSSGGSTSTSGDASGAKIGAFAGTTVQTVAKAVEDASQTVQQTIQLDTDGEEVDKGHKRPALAKSTGRVTVVLPSRVN